MASLSKVLATTTCIFKLMEEGKIRTASKVQNYLPQFAYEQVTIWHLLTHTSGLPEGISGLLVMKSAKDVYEKFFLHHWSMKLVRKLNILIWDMFCWG